MNTYNISPNQRRTWLRQQDGTILFMQGTLKAEGHLDYGQLEKAVNNVIAHNDILRTFYLPVREAIFPLMLVKDEVKVALSVTDLPGTAGELVTELERAMNELRSTPVNLENDTLLSTSVFRVSATLHYIVFTIPAIAADSYSVNRLMEQVCESYSGAVESNNEQVIQYPQFAGWQDSLIESPEQEAAEFWNENSPDLTTLPRSPFEKIHHGRNCYMPVVHKLAFSDELVDRVHRFSTGNNVTISSVIISTLLAINHLHSGSRNGVVGYVATGRSYDELADTLGSVSKVLSHSVISGNALTFNDLIQSVERKINDLVSWQDYHPVIESFLHKDGMQEHLYGFELVDLSGSLVSCGDVAFSKAGVSSNPDRFKLKITAYERADHTTFELTYDPQYFTPEGITEITRQIEAMLQELVSRPDELIEDISLDDSTAIDTALEKFNHTLPATSYQTVTRIFKTHVQQHSSRLAVVAANGSLTYKELDEKADALALKLRKSGVTPGTIVGIMADRTLEMAVGIMAIIKAGGAYLPLDFRYPAERIAYMIHNSSVQVIIKDPHLEVPLPDDLKVMNIAIDEPGNIEPIEDINVPSDLLYVIYTSGSTGKPKGVMIEHRNVHSLINSLYEVVYRQLPPGLNVGLVASYAFDGSVKQLFASFLLGHTLHILPEEVKTNGKQLAEYLSSRNIDITDVTPVHLNMLLNDEIEIERINVKCFLSGGQALMKNTVAAFYRKYTDRPTIVNVYGPTECCVDATSCTITPQNLDEFATIPIGRPILNTRVYILDKKRRPVPPGVLGEIYIGGHGVARGYLGLPEHSAEKFLQSPFREGERLYKTGDIGRWLMNGNIEFAGRHDDQVKVRGFRIELGEIENAIAALAMVSQVAVTVKIDSQGNSYPVAYVIADKKPDLSAIISRLRLTLPDYMLPTRFVHLKTLPVNASGKVDRMALPDPEGIEIRSEAQYLPPRNEIEEVLVKIWEEVLCKDKIGINDNFYETGGDSIKGIQVSAKLYKYGYKVEIRELFLNPSISSLSAKVKKLDTSQQPDAVTGIVPLTPIQYGFFATDDDPNYFNMSLTLRSVNRLEEDLIRSVFAHVMDHHDMLRAVFPVHENVRVQEIKPAGGALSFEFRDMQKDTDSEASFVRFVNEIHESMNIAAGPLLRVGLARMDDAERLIIVVHHLVFDGFSWRILLEDLSLLFTQSMEGKKISLPPRSESFKAWSEKLRSYASGKELLDEAGFWADMAGTNPGLPKDFPDGTCLNKDALNESFLLDSERTSALLGEANNACDTEAVHLMLAALGRAVKNAFGMQSLTVCFERHGREEELLGLNVSRTIGWFNAVHPFTVSAGDAGNVLQDLRQLKKAMQAVPNNGIGYGVLKYLSPLNGGNITLPDLPSMLFNYLGQIDSGSPGESIFRIEESRGMNISPGRRQRYEINLSLIVLDGRLNVNLLFNEKQYDPATIKSFMATYSAELEYIIDRCMHERERAVRFEI